MKSPIASSDSSEPDEILRARLRWRCRRGMRELDVLLERWLERRWSDAGVAERSAFERLLAVEDDVLWGWATGRGRPDDPQMAGVLDQAVAASRD